jgi:type IX secretion system substrate protein
MNKRFTYLLILILLIFGSSITVSATHLVGGEITYKQIDTNKFEVFVVLYRDCAGVSAPVSIDVDIQSLFCDTTLTVKLNRTPPYSWNITPLCPSMQQCSECNPQRPPICNGNTLHSVEQWYYKGIITVPAGCDDWIFSFHQCCRTIQITNLSQPGGGVGMYLESSIDMRNQPVSINNSPVFNAIPAVFGFVSQQQTFDFGAVDVDGDSLAYEMVTPLEHRQQPIQFASGLDSTHPLVGAVSFDSQTGLMTVTPSIPQVVVLAVQVNEFRNDSLIGKLRRDIQVIIVNDSTNQLPVISGIDSSNQFEIVAYKGDTVEFDIYSADGNTQDSVFMAWDSGIVNAQFNIDTNRLWSKGTFYWIIDSSSVQFKPHLFKVRVRDNHCPYNGEKTKYFKVYALADDSVSVWPGDANNDYKVDLFDALPIGIAYSDSGAQRINASTNWTAQYGFDWSNSFANSLNHKFADCNGDGLVDSIDLNVINQNYGLTHSRLSNINRNSVNADLQITYNKDTLIAGEWVTANITFGSSQNPINDLYGVTFSIVYDPSLIEAGTVSIDVQNSWIGQQNSDMLLFSKNITGNAVIHNTLVRTDQKNMSGNGQIAQLRFKIVDLLPQPTNILHLAISNQMYINNIEQKFQITTSVDSVMVNDQNVGIGNLESSISIYPNPADELIQIESDYTINGIEVFDMTGKLIISNHEQGKRIFLNTSSVAKGNYVIRIITEKGEINRQVNITH